MTEQTADVPAGFVEIDPTEVRRAMDALRSGFLSIMRLALVDLDAGRPSEAAAYLRLVLDRHTGRPVGTMLQ